MNDLVPSHVLCDEPFFSIDDLEPSSASQSQTRL